MKGLLNQIKEIEEREGHTIYTKLTTEKLVKIVNEVFNKTLKQDETRNKV